MLATHETFAFSLHSNNACGQHVFLGTCGRIRDRAGCQGEKAVEDAGHVFNLMVAAPAAPGNSSTMEEVVRAQLVRALSILKEK